jgi:hypothetical protein
MSNNYRFAERGNNAYSPDGVYSGIHIYNTSTHGEYVFTRGEQQKTDRTLSLFLPPVIEQQTPYATTQLGSSTWLFNISITPLRNKERKSCSSSNST